MFQIDRKRNTGNTSTALLLLGGTVSCLLVLIAGFLIYSNTQALDTAKDWVTHTQEVLTALQSTSQLGDHVEFGTRLYLLNKDETEFNLARLDAIEMEAAALHVKTLVVDNPSQTTNAQDLIARTQNLIRDVQGLSEQGHPPIESLLRCRETLKIMTEHERSLLIVRTQRSQHRYIVSLITAWTCVGLFLLKVIIVFAFLLREARLRRLLALQVSLTNEDLTDNVAALEKAAHQSRLLAACSDELQLCINVEQVYRLAADSLSRLLLGTSGSMCMINHSRNMVEVVSSWGNTALAAEETFLSESCCGLRLGQLRWRRPGMSEIDCTHFASHIPARYLCLPMVAQGETMGVLYVECVDDAAHLGIERHMESMRQILLLTGMAVAALHLRTKLEHQAIRDSLTGLFNRHFMEVVLQREMARAARMQTSVAVFMLDVDHFKRFNDTFGHAAGDIMLKSVSEIFRLNVRTEDTVCRYGGEEFAIILPGISAEMAYLRAELIRKAIIGLRVPLQNGTCGQSTVSIGMAFYPNDGITAEQVLRKADQALYLAKHNGRNQVVVSEVVLTPIPVAA
jgi:diguanylate cyclase (GGDEF)-like protein